MHKYTCVHIETSSQSQSISNHIAPHFMRQNLSLDLDLNNRARLADLCPPRNPRCFCPNTEITGMHLGFHTGSWGIELESLCLVQQAHCPWSPSPAWSFLFHFVNFCTGRYQNKGLAHKTNALALSYIPRPDSSF